MVNAGTDLIATVYFRVSVRQRVEERAVAAAEVADTDGAVGVGHHFEVPARQKLIGNPHVSLAADHQACGRNLELLTLQESLDADQHSPRRLRGRCARAL